MTSVTVRLRGEVAERLATRAAAEGRASVAELLGDLAEREADVDGSRLRRLHGLIQEAYDSPRRPLPDGYFDERKTTLEERMRRRAEPTAK